MPVTSPLATYGALKSAIASYLNRDDLADVIPTFIELAEQRIFRRLRCPNNEVHLHYDFPAGTAPYQVEVPSRYLEMKFVSVDGCPIERMTETQFLLLPAQIGTPTKWARIADRFYLWPRPAADAAMTLDLVYYGDFSGLGQHQTDEPTYDPDADTNSVLKIAGGLYLFGALAEAEPFLVNDPRVALWESKYEQVMTAIEDHSRRAELADMQIVMRSV